MKSNIILLISSIPDTRSILSEVLENRYQVLHAGNIRQGLLLFEQHQDIIDACLLDTQDENTDWESFLEHSKNIQKSKKIPVIIITAFVSEREYCPFLSKGAADVIRLPAPKDCIWHSIHTILELSEFKNDYEAFKQQQGKILDRISQDAICSFAALAEYRSPESTDHVIRVQYLTQAILEEIAYIYPEFGLTDESIRLMSSAAALHDIGKAAIPDHILQKPGKLTSEERKIMQSHPQIGCDILSCLKTSINKNYLRYAKDICLYHHERYDGKGYPFGLSGDDIPIWAQAAGLSDVYDALTGSRAYKAPIAHKDAVNMILDGKCGAFSPVILECFRMVAETFREISQELKNSDRLSELSLIQSLSSSEAPRIQDFSETEDLRSKYLAVLKLFSATAVEMDLSDRSFRVVYNPDITFDFLENEKYSSYNFDDIVKIIDEKLLVPNEKGMLIKIAGYELTKFMNDGFMEKSWKLHIINEAYPNKSCTYRLIFSRISHIISNDKKVLIFFKRLTEQDERFNEIEVLNLLSNMNELCVLEYDKYLTSRLPLVWMENALGYEPNEIKNKYHNRIIELVLPSDREELLSSLKSQLSAKTKAYTGFRMMHKNGSIVWIAAKIYLSDNLEKNISLICSFVDVSESKKKELEYLKMIEKYEIILSSIQNVVFEYDFKSNEISVSSRWADIFGTRPLPHFDPHTSDIFDSLENDSHIHPDDISIVFGKLSSLMFFGSNHEECDIRISNSEGQYIWCQIRVMVQYDENGSRMKMVGILININKEKQTTLSLEKAAERDGLTELLNKTAAKRKIDEYLSSEKNPVECAFIFMDLDNFKYINDTYGHIFGDAILSQVALEMKKIFLTKDIISRIGGDEFVILLKDLSDRNVIEEKGSMLLKAISALSPKDMPAERKMSASVGISISPQHGKTYDELLKKADFAVYRSKSSGKNTVSIYEDSFENFIYSSDRKDMYITTAPIDSNSQYSLEGKNLIEYALEELYSASDVKSSIEKLIELVGRKLNVSRIYIFENSSDNSRCSNTFEWCNTGIKSVRDHLQNISYADELPNYSSHFDENNIFFCTNPGEITHKAKKLQKVSSFLQCAIKEKGIFKGFMGFDMCDGADINLFSKEKIGILSTFAKILAVFLTQERFEKNMENNFSNLYSAISSQNSLIYVINKETFEIEFFNDNMKLGCPHIATGEKCYKLLAAASYPCPDCPLKKFLGADDRHKIRCKNEKFECISKILPLLNKQEKDFSFSVSIKELEWNCREAYMIMCEKKGISE